MKFAKMVREVRDSRGLTQDAFGKQLGVSGSTIANWETETCKSSVKNVVKIEKMFKALTKTKPKTKPNGKTPVKVKEAVNTPPEVLPPENGLKVTNGAGRHKVPVKQMENILDVWQAVRVKKVVSEALSLVSDEYGAHEGDLRKEFASFLAICMKEGVSLPETFTALTGIE